MHSHSFLIAHSLKIFWFFLLWLIFKLIYQYVYAMYQEYDPKTLIIIIIIIIKGMFYLRRHLAQWLV